jgi:hypothetical protein
MFRHRSAVFRESPNTKDHKYNIPLQVLIGFVILCVRRFPEDGSPVPKQVEVILIINCVIVCILLSAFVGQYIEYTKMHSKIT